MTIEGAPPSVLRIKLDDAGTKPAPTKYWTGYREVASREAGVPLEPVTIPHGDGAFVCARILR